MRNVPNSASQDLTGSIIAERLERRGFRQVSQSADGAHVLLHRDHIHIVVPGLDRRVPHDVVRMIERSLEPSLGPRWLIHDQPTRSKGREVSGTDISAGVVILDAIVLEPSDDGLWRAFLVDDITTIGYGNSRTGALKDLKAAAALRIGGTTEHIVLVTPDVL